MKILGTVLIAAASLGLGMIYGSEQRKKLKLLEGLCDMLDVVRAELAMKQSPLPDIIRLISTTAQGSPASFVRGIECRLELLGELGFLELWRESAEENLGALAPKDLETVIKLGSCLGRYDLEQQLLELDLCRSLLQKSLDASRSALPERRKLGMGLACAAGGLLVLVLI